MNMMKDTQNAYNRWASDYDSHPNPHNFLEHDEVLRLVHPASGQKILDAACGTGRYTFEFSKVGAEVTGTDFSEEMLQKAISKCSGVHFQNVDLSLSLPFPNLVFDTVNCAQALKHVKNLKDPLGEFFRVLKAGGRLVFSVTHPDMDWEGYDTKVKSEFVLSEHANIFHHRFCDYLEAIDSAGFTLDKLIQLPVSERIRHLLTPESYEVVKGRYQILIVCAIK